MLERFAIIVAGGSGTRMNSLIPKQFLILDNKPVLVHTINAFLGIKNITIVLVLPKDSFDQWEQIKNIFFKSNSNILVAIGGKTRFQSVKSGLEIIHQNNGLVAVHDAVRPLISTHIIEKSYEIAQKNGCAVVAVPSKDSIRRVVNDKNEALDRSQIMQVQTPQTFDLQKLKKAYQVEEIPTFTDDASVFEYAGNRIFLIEGDYKNIKITTPEDLPLAELFLKQ